MSQTDPDKNHPERPSTTAAPSTSSKRSNNKKPSSPRRVAASRANGKLSKGPTTPAGRRACANNPIKHGMLAETVVLAAESAPRFTALLDAFIAEHRPVTQSELVLVHKMVVAYWRQMRTWSIQKVDFDREMVRQTQNQFDPAVPIPVPFRAALAFHALTTDNNSGSLTPSLRYETTFDRQFNRALRDLIQLKSQRDPTAGLDTLATTTTTTATAASTWSDPSEEEEEQEQEQGETGNDLDFAIKS